MKCVDCKNTKYCDAYKTMDFTCCATGTPKYLPSIVADDIVYKIKAGATILGIDQDQYVKDIMDEVYEKLKK